MHSEMTNMVELPSSSATTPLQSNKRSPSPSSLDCQSLQTSLKRIRLSCSPGELRLQRDLSGLGLFGWQAVTNESMGAHPPTWRQANAELCLLDPLRLQLTYGDATLWIQIPRMYPHRPPLLSRADHSPTTFVVRDSPLGGLNGSSSSSSDNLLQCYPEVTAVMDWSPVRQIGDLLLFVLEQLAMSGGMDDRSTMSSSHDTALASYGSSPITTPLTTSTPSGSSSYQQSPQFFIDEEHKMEDGVHGATSGGFTQEFLAPNRFDVGYGKYENQLGSSSSQSSPQQQRDPYAMEL